MSNQQVNYVIYRSLMQAYEKFVSGLVSGLIAPNLRGDSIEQRLCSCFAHSCLGPV